MDGKFRKKGNLFATSRHMRSKDASFLLKVSPSEIHLFVPLQIGKTGTDVKFNSTRHLSGFVHKDERKVINGRGPVFFPVFWKMADILLLLQQQSRFWLALLFKWRNDGKSHESRRKQTRNTKEGLLVNKADLTRWRGVCLLYCQSTRTKGENFVRSSRDVRKKGLENARLLSHLSSSRCGSSCKKRVVSARFRKALIARRYSLASSSSPALKGRPCPFFRFAGQTEIRARTSHQI